ncbi:hypothetical protein [Neptuniibacter sp. QD37_11]|uniref:hypothetical protein n=1 Tax=Neptuniibacter sp. QD37_11 TaxID=3398209 RepID=UPI0039F4720A
MKAIIDAVKNDQFERGCLRKENCRQPSFVMTYDVVGFWSEPVKIIVHREVEWLHAQGESRADWYAEVTHSSGGQNTRTHKDALEAELNFAAAVVDAVSTAKEVVKKAHLLEAGYQAYQEDLKQREAEEEAKRAKALEKDPEIGIVRAKDIVKQMVARLKNDQRSKFIAGMRLSDTKYDVCLIKTGAGVTFYVDGDRCSRAKAEAFIAGSSFKKSELILVPGFRG